MVRRTILVVLSVVARLGSLGLAPGLLALGAASQVPMAKEPPRIALRLVAGRLYARADLVAAEKKVPAHLLVALGRPDALALHNRTAGLLELEPGEELDVNFGDYTAAEIIPDVSRLAFLEYLTMEYAAELEEIPVVGILGVHAFDGVRLRIDYEKKTLTLLPRKEVESETLSPEPEAPPAESEGAGSTPPASPAKAPEPELIRVPMTVDGGYYRFKVVINEDRVLEAAPATDDPDTWISAGIAEHLGHPGGDFPSAKLGTLDIARYVALRPGDAPDESPGQPDLLLGNNLLAHFRVTLDPHHKVLELEPVKEPRFPTEEQACFKALAARHAPDLEAFLEKHIRHRLARDVGGKLLEIRLGESPLDPKALNVAVDYFGRTRPAKRRSRVMLDLLKRLVVRQPEAYEIVRKPALDIALRDARQDEDPGAVHKARSEIGGLLLEKGELREAYRHLLSAAFGLPRDGMINYRLGRLYERKGQDERAWSRYLQAAITEEGGPDGLAGLKRLADKKGIKTPYDVDEMEKLLEGRIPAYQPASTYEAPDGKRPSRTVLAELFTGAQCRPCAAADLGFDGLPAHFAHGEVAILEHHLHVPAPEPLVSPAAVHRAQRLGVRGTPAAVLDGQTPVPRVGGPVEKAARAFRLVRTAVEERLKEPTPWRIALTGKVAKGSVAVVARVHGPEAEGLRLRLYLCEKTVLFPGRSKIVLHRFVNRAEMARGGVQILAPAGERVIERSIDLADVEDRLESHLDAVEDQLGREFPLRPTEIEPRQVAVVAFIEEASGRVVQAAFWEAMATERE